MALVVSLRAAAIGCHIWVEYVNTAQNPADPLSRGGLDDPVIQRRLATGGWKAMMPGALRWEEMLNINLDAAVDIITALGKGDSGG